MHMVHGQGISGRAGGGQRRRLQALLLQLLLFCAAALQEVRAAQHGYGYGAEGNEETLARARVEGLLAAGVKAVRVPEGEHAMMRECARAGLRVVIAVPPAVVMAGARDWVRRVLKPHSAAVMAVAVVEEEEKEKEEVFGSRRLKALRLLLLAMAEAGLAGGKIKLSSPCTAADALLKNAGGRFKPAVLPLLDFIAETGSVFMLEEEGKVEDSVLSSVFLAMAGAGVRDTAVLVLEKEQGVVRLVESSPSDAAGVMAVAGEGGRRELATLRTWCIARPDANRDSLQRALDWACGPGRADCDSLQPGGVCFAPDNLVSHASYAFNSYYQRSNFASDSCNFGGTATTTNIDPSSGGCIYSASTNSAVTSNSNNTNDAAPGVCPSLAAIATLSVLVLAGLAVSS